MIIFEFSGPSLDRSPTYMRNWFGWGETVRHCRRALHQRRKLLKNQNTTIIPMRYFIHSYSIVHIWTERLGQFNISNLKLQQIKKAYLIERTNFTLMIWDWSADEEWHIYQIFFIPIKMLHFSGSKNNLRPILGPPIREQASDYRRAFRDLAELLSGRTFVSRFCWTILSKTVRHSIDPAIYNLAASKFTAIILRAIVFGHC